MGPLDQLANGRRVAFDQDFHITVVKVSHVTREPETHSQFLGVGSKENPLDSTGHGQVYALLHRMNIFRSPGLARLVQRPSYPG